MPLPAKAVLKRGCWSLLEAQNSARPLHSHPHTCDAQYLTQVLCLPVQAMQRGKRYILKQQRPDGSWYGSWGVCFTYAVWFGCARLYILQKRIYWASC